MFAFDSHLWQVSNTNDLTRRCYLPHDITHLTSNCTTNTRIYLIKNNCWQTIYRSHQSLDTQHQTTNLTTRRHICHTTKRLIEIGSKHKLHIILTCRHKIYSRCNMHRHICVFHSQSLHISNQVRCNSCRYGLTGRSKGIGSLR